MKSVMNVARVIAFKSFEMILAFLLESNTSNNETVEEWARKVIISVNERKQARMKSNCKKKKPAGLELRGGLEPRNVSLVPAEVQAASDEGVHVRHLLNDFTGGFSGTVAWLSVHVDEERVWLAGTVTDLILQGGDVF